MMSIRFMHFRLASNSKLQSLVKLDDENKETAIIRTLFKKYDWRIRPKGLDGNIRTGGPVIVTTNLYLRTISKIDDVNMEYNTQFTFRESWNDARLAYGQLLHWDDPNDIPPFVLLAPDDLNQRIWMPDTFFQNEKQAQRHMIDKPNVLMRIYSNGDILYSVRLSLTLSCPMNLILYPMDRQMCVIDLASYAYTTDDIVYQWKDDTPIQLKDTVKSSLPSFNLIGWQTGYCTSKTATGEYSCLRVELHFHRMFSYYLLQLYIPSFMLVIVSWVSFWVDKASVPARVTLGVTTLLTITTQASGINAKLPPVSYTKAIDVWIGVCLAFVFGALLEYALVNYAGNEINRKKSKSKIKEMKPMIKPTPIGNDRAIRHMAQSLQNDRQSPTPLISNSKNIESSPVHTNSYEYVKYPPITPLGMSFHHCCDEERHGNLMIPIGMASIAMRKRKRNSSMLARCQRWIVALYKDADRPKKIDVLSRILFPMGFFMFNCVYWYMYY